MVNRPEVETLLAKLRGMELTPHECHRIACQLESKLKSFAISGFPDREQADFAVASAHQLANATGFMSGPAAFMTSAEMCRTMPTPMQADGPIFTEENQ